MAGGVFVVRALDLGKVLVSAFRKGLEIDVVGHYESTSRRDAVHASVA